MEKANLVINLCGVNIKVRAKYMGACANLNWNHDLRPKYQLSIVNIDTKQQFKTTFWGSVHDLVINNIEVTKSLLIDALHAIVTDAEAGTMSYENFCDEFGYEYEDTKPKGIYKQCEKLYLKFKSLFDENDDFNINKIHVQLSEIYYK